MLRIDRSVTPTMAKTPTLAPWELDLLRTSTTWSGVGTSCRRTADGSSSTDGAVTVAADALVVHCAADGLQEPAAAADLATRGDHAAAGPGRLPLLRRRARRLRRGDPRRRRGEERAVPALVVREHAGGLGRHERPRRPGGGVLRRRARHRGLEQPGRDQPGPGAAGHPGSAALDHALEQLRTWSAPGAARLAELSGA